MLISHGKTFKYLFIRGVSVIVVHSKTQKVDVREIPSKKNRMLDSYALHLSYALKLVLKF